MPGLQVRVHILRQGLDALISYLLCTLEPSIRARHFGFCSRRKKNSRSPSSSLSLAGAGCRPKKCLRCGKPSMSSTTARSAQEWRDTHRAKSFRNARSCFWRLKSVQDKARSVFWPVIGRCFRARVKSILCVNQTWFQSSSFTPSLALVPSLRSSRFWF